MLWSGKRPRHVGRSPRDDSVPLSWKRASVVGPAAVVVVVVVGLLLWGWMRAGTQVSRVTIAVLPFEHRGDDAERQYIAEGLAEETVALLGQVDPEHVSVIGRTSTRAYKGTNKSAAEIGRELGVEYLVEGSVQTEQGRLRVTSKLIRVRDQCQIWAESYDSQPASLLDLQQELSTTIARQIRLRLSPDRLTALARRHSRNAEAYDLYLRGRYFWNQFTPQTNRLAVEHYLRATQLDPEYTLAWSGLADAYTGSPINGDAPSLEAALHARHAAQQAIKFGPDLAETQASLGLVNYWFDWDWPAAETAFRKAISIDPSYSLGHRTLGIVLAYLGRHEEAARRCAARGNLNRFSRWRTRFRRMWRSWPTTTLQLSSSPNTQRSVGPSSGSASSSSPRCTCSSVTASR